MTSRKNDRINDRKTEKISIRSISACAMLSAVAFVLQFLEFSLPIIPSFVKLDVSDIPALIGTFVLGPTWGIAIEFIKNLIHIPFGTSMGVGELCNFLLGAVFVFSAGLIYKFKHTRTGRDNRKPLRSLADVCSQPAAQLLLCISCLCGYIQAPT